MSVRGAPVSVPVDLLVPAWVALVAAVAWSRRPRRSRPPITALSVPAVRAGPLGRLGGALRRAVGAPDDLEAARALGGALVIAAVLAVVAPPLLPVPLLGAALAPPLGRRRRQRATAEAWADAVPDAVDLFALALGSGLTVPLALPVVAGRAPPPLGPALAQAGDRFGHGEPLADALGRVTGVGPPARPLVAILVAAHCDGAPVVEPLARLADELRTARRRAAEARARQVPVRMLFPLVCCTLPAFVLLTVVPPVVSALGDLQR